MAHRAYIRSLLYRTDLHKLHRLNGSFLHRNELHKLHRKSIGLYSWADPKEEQNVMTPSISRDIERLVPGNFAKGTKQAMDWVARQVSGDGEKNSTCFRIAFIDTGCDKNHPHFKDWNIVCRSFTDSVGDTDPHGHGTIVIGLFCSMFSNTDLSSRIEIHSYKVTRGVSPAWDNDAVLQALQDIRDAKPPFSIINISGGYPGYPPFTFPHQNLVNDIAGQAAVICAASNDGVNDADQILFPASETISIGSCTDDGNVSDFSPQSRLLLFLAQGQDIKAPLSRQAAVPHSQRPLYTEQCTGTSFAAPLASGIAAMLILKASVKKFGLTEEEKRNLVTTRVIKRLLRETTDYPHDTHRGYGPLRPQILLQDDDLFQSKLNKVLQRTELYRYGTDV